MFGIEDVRMLIIDTEGFDAAVITALPFEYITPAVIVFEHEHLTAEDRTAANEHLLKHCYLLFQDPESIENTFAIHLSHPEIIPSDTRNMPQRSH